MKTPIVAALLTGLAVAGVATAMPAAPVSAPEYSNRIIFIRHAEKGFTAVQPDSGESWGPPHGDEPPKDGPRPPRRGGWPFPGGPGGGGRRGPPNGLSVKGKERAQYLRTLFGEDSDYDFGLIFATPRDPENKADERTYATVAPLAEDLGLEIEIGCADSPSCVSQKVSEFVETSDADILISWKHRDLNVIATALGAPNAKIHYPDERNDVIWIMQGGRIVEKRSMHMPGLDDGCVDEGDPDLVVEDETTSQGLFGFLYSAWSSLIF